MPIIWLPIWRLKNSHLRVGCDLAPATRQPHAASPFLRTKTARPAAFALMISSRWPQHDVREKRRYPQSSTSIKCLAPAFCLPTKVLARSTTLPSPRVQAEIQEGSRRHAKQGKKQSVSPLRNPARASDADDATSQLSVEQMQCPRSRLLACISVRPCCRRNDGCLECFLPGRVRLLHRSPPLPPHPNLHPRGRESPICPTAQPQFAALDPWATCVAFRDLPLQSKGCAALADVLLEWLKRWWWQWWASIRGAVGCLVLGAWMLLAGIALGALVPDCHLSPPIDRFSSFQVVPCSYSPALRSSLPDAASASWATTPAPNDAGKLPRSRQAIGELPPFNHKHLG
ncbi:hypothetical protein EDB81DRAFT_158051 [Dactylonectria macrodidyma]|uniref:Uncharacterized protein n=1 Tax=Dactylonectria macrodidyma TaxID=307937 RepID=A0A9P9FMV7_9HYPO|nr:hypothetical protein EDB81DRAFT_158051 [Dactylonectria macrodidyma]